jgi:hypothetical protein
MGLLKNILQNQWTNFSQTWHKLYPWINGIQTSSMERDNPFSREDNSKKVKIH